jgi:hypothetical protein
VRRQYPAGLLELDPEMATRQQDKAVRGAAPGCPDHFAHFTARLFYGLSQITVYIFFTHI